MVSTRGVRPEFCRLSGSVLSSVQCPGSLSRSVPVRPCLALLGSDRLCSALLVLLGPLRSYVAFQDILCPSSPSWSLSAPSPLAPARSNAARDTGQAGWLDQAGRGCETLSKAPLLRHLNTIAGLSQEEYDIRMRGEKRFECIDISRERPERANKARWTERLAGSRVGPGRVHAIWVG